MAEWKKIIVSGSQAELAAVTASLGLVVGTNTITTDPNSTSLGGAFSGSFQGDGSNLTGVSATQLDIDNFGSDHTGITIADTDKLAISDAGTEGRINASQISDFVFAKVSGDVSIASDGTATVQANGVELGTDTTGDYVADITAGSGLNSTGATSGEGISHELSVDSGSLLPFISSSVFGTVSGDITITDGGVASIQANSVALGTDTTGDYVAALGSGTGVTIGSNSGEGSNPTIAVDYGSTSNTAVQGNTSLTIQGTSNEIEVSGGSITLGSGGTATIGLPDSVSITSDLTVGGDLSVLGTTTTVNTANLLVEDKFILLNSGSANPDEAGLVVDEGSAAGHAFVYDSNTTRWAFTGSLASDATSVAPDAFVAAVIDENVAESSDKAEYQKPGNIRVTAGGDIFIYV